MRKSPTNPPTNEIPTSIDEATLLRAVETSGYPLQGIVAEKLELAGFRIAEEWGFIDGDTNEHRSLDLFASQNLKGSGDTNVAPGLALLIECKRTVHPYVFFRKVSEVPASIFPYVAGVHVTIEESDGKRMFSPAPGQLILGLGDLAFVQDPPRCASFSKATPSGKKIELSGEEPFNKIVLPLVKALKYATSLYLSPRTDPRPTLALCVCVLDAPMLLVESPSTAMDPVLTPWIRVLRLQANQDSSGSSHVFYGIDVIHISAFEGFLTNHLAPFAQEFAHRANALGEIWKVGGVVSDLDSIRWDGIVSKRKSSA